MLVIVFDITLSFKFLTSLGVSSVGKQLDVKWRNWGNGQKSRSGNRSCKNELIIDRGDLGIYCLSNDASIDQ